MRTQWNTPWEGKVSYFSKASNSLLSCTTFYSHNQVDTERLFRSFRMNELGLLPTENKVYFGQLLGMCDQISFPLGEKNKQTCSPTRLHNDEASIFPAHKDDLTVATVAVQSLLGRVVTVLLCNSQLCLMRPLSYKPKRFHGLQAVHMWRPVCNLWSDIWTETPQYWPVLLTKHPCQLSPLCHSKTDTVAAGSCLSVWSSNWNSLDWYWCKQTHAFLSCFLERQSSQTLLIQKQQRWLEINMIFTLFVHQKCHF